MSTIIKYILLIIISILIGLNIRLDCEDNNVKNNK